MSSLVRYVDHTYRDYSRYVKDGGELLKHKKSGNNFPARLHRVLSDEENADVITWMPHGRAFKIREKDKLISIVLPKYFVCKKYESFSRQLNGWGFKRLHQSGADNGCYYHECFLRGIPDVTCLIRRLPSNLGKCAPFAEGEPDFYLISEQFPVPPKDDNDPPDPVVPGISADMREAAMRRDNTLKQLSAPALKSMVQLQGMLQNNQAASQLAAASAAFPNGAVPSSLSQMPLGAAGLTPQQRAYYESQLNFGNTLASNQGLQQYLAYQQLSQMNYNPALNHSGTIESLLQAHMSSAAVDPSPQVGNAQGGGVAEDSKPAAVTTSTTTAADGEKESATKDESGVDPFAPIPLSRSKSGQNEESEDSGEASAMKDPSNSEKTDQQLMELQNEALQRKILELQNQLLQGQAAASSFQHPSRLLEKTMPQAAPTPKQEEAKAPVKLDEEKTPAKKGT